MIPDWAPKLGLFLISWDLFLGRLICLRKSDLKIGYRIVKLEVYNNQDKIGQG